MNIRPRIVLLLSSIVLINGCAHSPRHVNLPEDTRVYDKEFLQWLVTYHQNQDRKTAPCADNATIRAELRTFCVHADEQHAVRLGRLQTWLKAWYDDELPRPDSHPLWLSSLKGEDFEKEFLREYLEDHGEAVEQTTKCALKGVHDELREFCAQINAGQRKTDTLLKQWRCSWFRECK